MTTSAALARLEPHSRRIERCVVIVNAQAGGVRRRPAVEGELRKVLGLRGDVLCTHRLEELTRAVGRARVMGADTLAICGGDGTNLHTLTAMAQVYGSAAWPRIAVLAGGTINTAAGNLGTTRWTAPEALARLLAADEPLTRRQPLLRVNGRIGFTFGSQMVARILDEYYAGTTGPAGAALLAARIVASAVVRGPLAKRIDEREEVGVAVDGETERSFGLRALAASVLPCIAVGMRLLPRAGENGGFHLIATEHRTSEFAGSAARVWVGLPVQKMCVDVVARRVALRRDAGIRYTIDGDLFKDPLIAIEATAPVEILTP